jgi:hypothetical protein
MINPELERRYADCTVLVEEWGAFFDLVNRALKSNEAIQPQVEQQFLAVKARIAMLHDSFMESLKHDKPTGNKMLEIVNRSITLKSVRKASEPEQKKTESEWHECFLLLNETVSALDEERARIANINEWAWRLGKVQTTIFVHAKAILNSIFFKIFATIAVIIFVLVGIQAFGIYDYDKLRDVRQLRGISTLYLKTMRAMGLDMAFIDLKAAKDRLKAPTGLDMASDGGDFSKERAADVIAGYNNYNNPELREALLAANEYDRMTFNPAGDNFKRAQAYLFWYRKSSDMRRAALYARTNTPSNFLVETRGNVLVLINSQDAELASRVRLEAVRKM